jgi:hypothetical protein
VSLKEVNPPNEPFKTTVHPVTKNVLVTLGWTSALETDQFNEFLKANPDLTEVEKLVQSTLNTVPKFPVAENPAKLMLVAVSW